MQRSREWALGQKSFWIVLDSVASGGDTGTRGGTTGDSVRTQHPWCHITEVAPLIIEKIQLLC